MGGGGYSFSGGGNAFNVFHLVEKRDEKSITSHRMKKRTEANRTETVSVATKMTATGKEEILKKEDFS